MQHLAPCTATANRIGPCNELQCYSVRDNRPFLIKSLRITQNLSSNCKSDLMGSSFCKLRYRLECTLHMTICLLFDRMIDCAVDLPITLQPSTRVHFCSLHLSSIKQLRPRNYYFKQLCSCWHSSSSARCVLRLLHHSSIPGETFECGWCRFDVYGKCV